MKKNLGYLFYIYRYSIIFLVISIVFISSLLIFNDFYLYIKELFVNSCDIKEVDKYKGGEKLKDLYLGLFNIYLAFLGLYVGMLGIFFSMKQLIIKLVDNNKSLVKELVTKIHLLFYITVSIIIILLLVTLYIVLIFGGKITIGFFALILFFIFCILIFIENIKYLYGIFSVLINKYISGK